jgi:D-alanyl-D-alanine dipeptidase
MARAGKEIIRRLTAPELREILREEMANALQPVNVRARRSGESLRQQS